MNKEKTIIEITGCTWKQATDALQQILISSSAESPPNDDEVISAACEQVRNVIAFEKHRKSEEDARKAHEIAMEESKHMIITSRYGTLQAGNGPGGAVPAAHMLGLRPARVIGLFEKLRAVQGIMVSGVEIEEKEAYKSSLEIAITVSNFTAYANCLLNPCGILVQLKKDIVDNLELEVPDAKTKMMRKAKNLLVLTIAFSQISVGAALPLASAVAM
ncbi:predicted protein [Chaetoceros tenuissimus]|uniref:Uncharacterized protein n=1 Tax=Chaetoceros tenuissimus TaxID=426638 RepID=A0AAD3H6P0_9STRA|nr:predicted protein [Chaetoceros tenuissimus]